MKMSDVDGNEQESLVKHLIQQFMKDQLNELKEGKQETNNSFVFLENSTLDMLILYMLMNGGQRTKGEMNEDDGRLSNATILEGLDHVIVENEKGFEEIIALLKERI